MAAASTRIATGTAALTTAAAAAAITLVGSSTSASTTRASLMIFITAFRKDMPTNYQFAADASVR